MSTAAVSNNDVLSSLGLTSKPKDKTTNQLGQDDFLKLLTTQLTNQDPTKPLDGNDFLGQLAQFSQVSGIQALQTSFSSLADSLTANQSVQAAGLVGHAVLFPSNTGFLDGEAGLNGAVSVPSTGDVVVEVTDGAGQVVRRIDYGVQSAGTTYFKWDGKDASGKTLPDGSYGVRASVIQNGATHAAQTFAAGFVQSVSLGSGGLNLNLTGFGQVPFTKVTEIV